MDKIFFSDIWKKKEDWIVERKNAYSSKETLSPFCSRRPLYMNFGPHHAKAPVTNATHVKPNVDSINDGFRKISANSKKNKWNINKMFLLNK